MSCPPFSDGLTKVALFAFAKGKTRIDARVVEPINVMAYDESRHILYAVHYASSVLTAYRAPPNKAPSLQRIGSLSNLTDLISRRSGQCVDKKSFKLIDVKALSVSVGGHVGCVAIANNGPFFAFLKNYH